MDQEQDNNRKGEAAPLPPPEGLRRSRRLRTSPPPPPSREGGSNSCSERKRPRRQEEDSRTEEDALSSAQVNPDKVEEDNGGLEWSLEEAFGSGGGAAKSNRGMMNNGQEGEQEREDAPPSVLVDGLRRSRRLQSLHPPPPPSFKAASERKRSGRQEDEDGPQKGVSAGDDVTVGLHGVSSNEVKVTSGGMSLRSLSHRQPLILEYGMVGGTSSSSLSSSVMGSTAAARSSDEMSSKDSAEDGEAHPCLFIENVLDVIFKYVINQPGPRSAIANDVQSIRLVCKTWQTSITRLYRRTRPATQFHRYREQSRPREGGDNSKSLVQFLWTMRSSQMIPTQNYEFVWPVLRHKNLKMFSEFLRLCGPEAVVLELDIGSGVGERIMATLENLPNLELMKLKTLTLTIECPDEFQAGEAHGLVRLTEFLLTAAKTLREFQFFYDMASDTASETYRRQHEIVAQLSAVIAKRIPRTVKQLALDIHESAYANLAEMRAKLERVEVDLRDDSVSSRNTFHEFLQSQATTLKHLEISTDDVNAKELFVELPRLGELVKLVLTDGTVRIAPPSQFDETFPKLKYLDISGVGTHNAISTLLSTVKKPDPSLTELHLPVLGDFTFPAPLVKDLAQSFPCLAELHLGLQPGDEGTLVEVFNYLGSLESLYINLFDFEESANWTDTLFSGIPASACGLYRTGKLQSLDAEKLKELQHHPSIRNLTRLWKLVIKECEGNRQIVFTDVSAFVFLEMVNLREIHLVNSTAQCSPMFLDRLSDKLVFTAVEETI